jgi:hypothetical protein
MPYKRGSIKWKRYFQENDRFYIAHSYQFPGYDVWRPGSPVPESFDDFISVVGNSLAALWWIQWDIYDKHDLDDDLPTVFSTLRISSYFAVQLKDRYVKQLRNVHKPTVPRFAGRAVTSYNEYACECCAHRADYLFEWLTGKEQAEAKDVSPPQLWVKLAAFVASRMDQVRESWPFEPIDTDELATCAELEASWLRVAKPDGPFGTDGFRWQQIEYHGLRGKPFALVLYLWDLPDRVADFDDLAEPVWGDHAANLGADQVGSARREANRFFSKRKIPLSVVIRKRRVELVEGSLITE